jgi:mono/diheme cytochrome c family protein
MAIFMALVFWGGVYLAYYSGGFRADSFNPRRGMAGPAVDLNDPVTMGKRVFTQNCVLCHQATGLGVPRIYPPLAGSEWVLAREWRGDNHLVNILLHGMQGAVEVDGKSFDNAMPPWKILRDEEIAAVLTYIRSEWGNSAPPITTEFVRERRERTARRTDPWSPNELRDIARQSVPAPSATPSLEPHKFPFRGKAAR